jgi:hypothetical protein
MSWTNKRRGQSRFVVTLRRIQLGLDQEDAPSEVGTPEVGTSEVGTDEVGHPQVGTSEVGTDEVRPSQAGASEVGALELGPDEVSPPVVRLGVSDLGSHVLARLQQQGIDVSPVGCHVELQQSLGAALSECVGRVQRNAELNVEGSDRLQCLGFGQIPEQLMEVPHDRKDFEHLLCGSRGLPPVLPAVSNLGDLLPRAEAVIDGATPETLLPEACVNSAAEVRLQMGTSVPCGFVDREVRRGREGRGDAAQGETARAVSAQVKAISLRRGLCVLALLRQCAWSPWIESSDSRRAQVLDSLFLRGRWPVKRAATHQASLDAPAPPKSTRSGTGVAAASNLRG